MEEGEGIVWLAAVKRSLEKALVSLPLPSSLWEAAASAAGPVSGKSSTLHQLSKREEGGIEEESPA